MGYSPKILSMTFRTKPNINRDAKETFLPLYDEEVRDNILEALCRHNPRWFETALDFLVNPVEDSAGKKLDFFKEEAEFLFQTGWIDEDTLRRLQEENARGEKRLIQAVKARLLRGRPCVDEKFPQYETYARIKSRVFLEQPFLSDDVACFLRGLKADEFKLLAWTFQKEGRDWATELPQLTFRHYFQRLAFSLVNTFVDKAPDFIQRRNSWDPMNNDAIVRRLFYWVFHRKTPADLPPDFSMEKWVPQLRWIAFYLKDIFRSFNEAKLFWEQWITQISDRVSSGKDQVKDPFFSTERMLCPPTDFIRALNKNGLPPANAHPLNFQTHYQKYPMDALEVLFVESCL